MTRLRKITLRIYIFGLLLGLSGVFLAQLLFPKEWDPVAAASTALETSVTLYMFRLNEDGSSTGLLCTPLIDTSHGCTAFENDPNHAYPYTCPFADIWYDKSNFVRNLNLHYE